MRSHRTSLLAPFLCLALIAGCSGSDDPGASGTDQSPAGSSTSGPPTNGGSATGTSATTSAGRSTGSTPSPGCRREGDVASPGRTVLTLQSDGQERTYVRYVPEGLTAGAPAPLVVDFPAYSPASLEESFSGFTKPDADGLVKADEVGAVVVTPEPVNGAGALLTWNYVGTDGWTDDQQFVTDLLDDVGASTCIDTDRVLATGFAVGAVFASITACEQADRIAVLATVSGLYSPGGCDPSGPVPVISVHGTGDRFVPFDGGVGSGPAGLGLSPETISGLVFMAGRPGAIDSSTAWAGHDGCATQPTEEPTGPDIGDGVTRDVWPGCDDGASVELYVIDGGEHTWPGSVGMDAYEDLLGPVSDALDATDLIWAFFEAHT